MIFLQNTMKTEKGRVGAGLGNWHSETALEEKYESFAKLRDQIEQEKLLCRTSRI